MQYHAHSILCFLHTQLTGEIRKLQVSQALGYSKDASVDHVDGLRILKNAADYIFRASTDPALYPKPEYLSIAGQHRVLLRQATCLPDDAVVWRASGEAICKGCHTPMCLHTPFLYPEFDNYVVLGCDGRYYHL